MSALVEFLTEVASTPLEGEDCDGHPQRWDAEGLKARLTELVTKAREVAAEVEHATQPEIERAREKYAYGFSDDIEIDDGALVSRGDEGCFVQAWVWLKDEESDAARRCNMHEWDHYEDIRRHYKGKRFEIVDNELVGHISYYLVFHASWPQGLRFHYMSDKPDFSCAYDSLAEVGEPFKQWFIDAMNRYSEKKQS